MHKGFNPGVLHEHITVGISLARLINKCPSILDNDFKHIVKYLWICGYVYWQKWATKIFDLCQPSFHKLPTFYKGRVSGWVIFRPPWYQILFSHSVSTRISAVQKNFRHIRQTSYMKVMSIFHKVPIMVNCTHYEAKTR